MGMNRMTNGDWLQSMTMDDLSDFLYKITDCCCELGQAGLCISCERVGCPLYYDENRRVLCCKESIRQWLDKEFVPLKKEDKLQPSPEIETIFSPSS